MFSQEPSKLETETTINLVANTMNGKFGIGDERKKNLGSGYSEVQNLINHIVTASAQTLVQEMSDGKYGNGEFRKVALGTRYNEIQSLINDISRQVAQYYTVQFEDMLSGIVAKRNTIYQAIAYLNILVNPNLIYVGHKLRAQ